MPNVKILKKHIHELYAEMPQPNPLSWRIMHKRGDTLVSQSCPIRCKDFFNDIVAYKNAKYAFSIYSFDNRVKFNKGGLPVLLTNIADRNKFMYNFAVVAIKLDDDLDVDIQTYDVEEGVVVVIPNKVLKSTYYTSLLTMMIRCCNYDIEYECWDDFFAEDAPMNTVENAFDDDAKIFTKEAGFKLLPKYRKLWYNSTHGYNSASGHELVASIIHNNGVVSWVKSMNEEN